MSNPEPGDMGLTEEFSGSLEDRPTLERIYDVALQLYESTRVSDVARRADVSPETARKYLEFLTEVGVLVRTGEDPDEFVRNETYFEWRESEHLRREYSVAELESRLEDLSETIGELQDQYDAVSPDEIDPRQEGYGNVDQVYGDLRRWRDAREEIDRILSVLGTESEPAAVKSMASLFRQAASIAADQSDCVFHPATDVWSGGETLTLGGSFTLPDETLPIGEHGAHRLSRFQIAGSGQSPLQWTEQRHQTAISGLGLDMPVNHRLEEFAEADTDDG